MAGQPAWRHYSVYSRSIAGVACWRERAYRLCMAHGMPATSGIVFFRRVSPWRYVTNVPSLIFFKRYSLGCYRGASGDVPSLCVQPSPDGLGFYLLPDVLAFWRRGRYVKSRVGKVGGGGIVCLCLHWASLYVAAWQGTGCCAVACLAGFPTFTVASLPAIPAYLHLPISTLRYRHRCLVPFFFCTFVTTAPLPASHRASSTFSGRRTGRRERL